MLKKIVIASYVSMILLMIGILHDAARHIFKLWEQQCVTPVFGDLAST